jgi:cell division septum initiation protein DivIVA
MTNGDLRDEISELETRIEKLADSLERCRKMIRVSKLSIAIGAILLFATIVGLLGFVPLIMILAVAAVLGGIVMFGSTTTTAKETAAAMRQAEMRRAQLIGKIDLRLVGNGASRRDPYT